MLANHIIVKPGHSQWEQSVGEEETFRKWENGKLNTVEVFLADWWTHYVRSRLVSSPNLNVYQRRPKNMILIEIKGIFTYLISVTDDKLLTLAHFYCHNGETLNINTGYYNSHHATQYSYTTLDPPLLHLSNSNQPFVSQLLHFGWHHFDDVNMTSLRLFT